MKTTLQIKLRLAATSILLSGCFLMSSQNGAPVIKTGENDPFIPAKAEGGSQEGARMLSIDLLAFSAVNNEGQVNITWITSNEKNDSFLVERSVDGLTWERRALNIEQRSGDAYYYNCVDASPCNNDISYYRLKQTDLKGNYSYSDIVAVEMEKQVKLTVYPNPAVSYVQIISDSKTTKESNVAFYNSVGRLVKQISGNINNTLIDVMDLEAGNYFAVIDSGTKVSRVQFIKN
jgi:hypothetical protein